MAWDKTKPADSEEKRLFPPIARADKTLLDDLFDLVNAAGGSQPRLTRVPPIKAGNPYLRLIGTESSGADWRLVEDAGSILLQENTGSETTPTWVTRLSFLVSGPFSSNIHIKKDTPSLRLIGTEGSAKDWQLIEVAGQILLEENTGSEGSPSWVTRYTFEPGDSGGFDRFYRLGVAAASQGDVVISSNTTLNGLQVYDNLTIDSTFTLTHDSERALFIKVKGALIVNGSISADAKGLARPAAGLGGEGRDGKNGGIAPGGAGGGAQFNQTKGGNGGNSILPTVLGGVGGTGTGNTGQTSPTAIPNYILDQVAGVGGLCFFLPGSSGGNGGGKDDNYGQGGQGGGILIIEADTITVGASGSIVARGQQGGSGTTTGNGTGGDAGGGGGGVIVLRYRSLSNSGTISVAGGAAGTSGPGPNGTAGATGLLVQEEWI